MRIFATALICISFTNISFSQELYNEGFNVVTPLPAGWAFQNNSSPIGTTNWEQGDITVFPANSGPADSYIFGNYTNVDDNGGTISNWLFNPVVTLTNGDIFTFYTRVPTGGGAFPDRLEVRMSTSGASANVGATAESLGDFTTLLLSINPTLTATGYPEDWTQFTITISGLAAPVSGRIAFRYYVTDAGFSGSNSNYIGIDDVVYTTFPFACSGTPAPGNTIASVPEVCPDVPFSLSVENSTGGSGVTYQWQSSTDNVTYTDIPGATLATLTTTQSAATYYHLNVICGANTGVSTAIQVAMAPGLSCYCAAGSTDTDPAFEKIDLVEFGDLNNASTSFEGYESFLALTPVPSYEAGSTTPITITGNANTYGGDVVAVWIDYNHNGTFTDAGENAYTSGLSAGPYNGNITIPASATTGNTRMRIRMFNAIFGNGTNGPCGNNTYGQVEDYNINITPCIPVSVSAQPTDASAVCGGDASFSFGAAGTSVIYQWQQRDNATAAWTDLANGPNYAGVTTSTLTITAAPLSFDGYQYRAVYTGGCTATDASTEGTLTVTSLVATVDPPSATICNGSGPQLLSITNSAAAPTTITVSSGPLTISIPDNTENGVSTDLAVAGIPPTAVITGVSVKFSMTHTYCGDMLLALKAPNGSILALDKYLTATGSQAGTYPNTGFVNTIISSAGTTALGTAAAQPITGTFRADAINVTIPFPVQNPAGFVSDAANFAALYSIPNGTWTFAMADGGPADFGVLTSWSIDISYVSPTLATGIWSPLEGLYNDVAMTSPYIGNAVTTVYAAPTVSTDYSVIVSTAVCTSEPTIIPVTVANPVGWITQPADANVCAGGDVSITADAADGNPITYQWQESTDDGATWTDVLDGGNYSGATTNTLNISGVPSTFDEYQYRLVFLVAACSSTANSDAAILEVNANPAVSIAAAPFTSLYPGLITTLTATLTPPGTDATYEWFLDGNSIPGVTGSTYVANIDGLGTYSVVATTNLGCSASSTASVTITDSLNTNLFIYPNPNSGVFQVRFNDQVNGVSNARTLNVYDSKGSRVYSAQYTVTVPFGRMDVDLRRQSKGVYFIDLTDAAGRRLQTERVVIY